MSPTIETVDICDDPECEECTLGSNSETRRDKLFEAEDRFHDLLRDHVGFTIFQYELLNQALDMAGLELRMRRG